MGAAKCIGKLLGAAFAIVGLLLFMAGCTSAETVIKDSANDYTWEELSAISELIAEADSENAAIEIAQSYNLANADGTLDGTQAKDIAFADGTTTRAVIVGLAQDVRPDGSPIGITFMIEGTVGPRAMNNDAGFSVLSDSTDMNTIGGWAASELRMWLNDNFASMLPTDLSKVLVEAEKTSTAVPTGHMSITDGSTLESDASTLVETTSDRLWIPSVSEISGVSDETYSAELDVVSSWRDILRLEGRQYKLFADSGVREEEQNPLLIKELVSSDPPGEPTSWWLRTIEDSFFYDVSQNGEIDRSKSDTSPADPKGIVVLFCI